LEFIGRPSLPPRPPPSGRQLTFQRNLAKVMAIRQLALMVPRTEPETPPAQRRCATAVRGCAAHPGGAHP